MRFVKSTALAVFVGLSSMALLAACSPEVGSKEWCEDLKKKDKGSWTANEAKDFAKSCIL